MGYTYNWKDMRWVPHEECTPEQTKQMSRGFEYREALVDGLREEMRRGPSAGKLYAKLLLDTLTPLGQRPNKDKQAA